MNLISNAFHQLGNTNSNAANEKKAIEYYKKSIFVQKENDSTYRSVTGAMNIGSIYSGSGQLDSAFIYATRALKNARITGYKDYAGSIRAIIGNVYFKKGVLDSAKYYYKTSAKVNREQNNVSSEIRSNLSLAKLYYIHCSFHLLHGY